MFAIFVAWLIYFCQSNRSSRLNRFLSHKAFHPVAALSYMVKFFLFFKMYMETDENVTKQIVSNKRTVSVKLKM